jgi:hypothetical protein
MLVFFLAWCFGPLACETSGAGTSSETLAYESAVEYCRGDVARPLALSDDRNVLCFDGYINPGQNLSLVERLKEGGLFILRSGGGDIETAIALAHLLRDRHATVVVYDYCNSACASYLFIATDRTVVRKRSIVTWHPPHSGLPDCFGMASSGDDDAPKMLQRSPCADVPEERLAAYERIRALSLAFYQERTLIPGAELKLGLYVPQSFHVRRALKNMMDGTGDFPDVVWMWNPRYYRNLLKTQVIYEAYPESQDEVDEIASQFWADRVVYDP